MNRRSFFKSIVAVSAMSMAGTKIILLKCRWTTFDEIVAATFRKRANEIARNVTQSNALYQRLSAARG